MSAMVFDELQRLKVAFAALHEGLPMEWQECGEVTAVYHAIRALDDAIAEAWPPEPHQPTGREVMLASTLSQPREVEVRLDYKGGDYRAAVGKVFLDPPRIIVEVPTISPEAVERDARKTLDRLQQQMFEMINCRPMPPMIIPKPEAPLTATEVMKRQYAEFQTVQREVKQQREAEAPPFKIGDRVAYKPPNKHVTFYCEVQGISQKGMVEILSRATGLWWIVKSSDLTRHKPADAARAG